MNEEDDRLMSQKKKKIPRGKWREGKREGREGGEMEGKNEEGERRKMMKVESIKKGNSGWK